MRASAIAALTDEDEESRPSASSESNSPITCGRSAPPGKTVFHTALGLLLLMWRVLCMRVRVLDRARARACVQMRALTMAIDFQQSGADDLVELEMLQLDIPSFKTFEHIPGGGGLSG